MKHNTLTIIVFVLIGAIFALSSCEYKHDNNLFKDSKGNLYRAEQAPCGDCYRLEPIDTTQLNQLNNFKNN